VSPGGGQGVSGVAGAQGVQGPTAVSADTGNIATLGSDSLILVPKSTIWNVRLRSFNAIGNPTFEVDQRTYFTGVTNQGGVLDRWNLTKNGTMTDTAVGTFGLVPVPGSSFNITQYFLRTTLTGQETSLAAGDYLFFNQSVEGPLLREICSDVMSLQVLVRSSVAGLKFGITLRDGGTTRTLALLATIPSANTWTLCQFPNLPSFVSSGASLSLAPGTVGFLLCLGLAVGTTNTAPSNNTWLSGNWVQAAGADNFASKPVSSTFDCAYVGLEPGPECSMPQDLRFTDNLLACQRYFAKSYDYNAVPSGTGAGEQWFYSSAAQFAFGIWPFPSPMAKTPTVSIFNSVNGTANSAHSYPGNTAYAVASTQVTSKALTYLSGSTLVASQSYRFLAVADTGW
jgi:hypothetical protein